MKIPMEIFMLPFKLLLGFKKRPQKNRSPIDIMKSCGSPPRIAMQRKSTDKKKSDLRLLFIPLVKDHRMAGSHISVDRLFNVLMDAIVYPP